MAVLKTAPDLIDLIISAVLPLDDVKLPFSGIEMGGVKDATIYCGLWGEQVGI